MEPYSPAVVGHLPGQRTATAFPCPLSVGRYHVPPPCHLCRIKRHSNKRSFSNKWFFPLVNVHFHFAFLPEQNYHTIRKQKKQLHLDNYFSISLYVVVAISLGSSPGHSPCQWSR